jgi:hypothetical protein
VYRVPSMAYRPAHALLYLLTICVVGVHGREPRRSVVGGSKGACWSVGRGWRRSSPLHAQLAQCGNALHLCMHLGVAGWTHVCPLSGTALCMPCRLPSVRRAATPAPASRFDLVANASKSPPRTAAVLQPCRAQCRGSNYGKSGPQAWGRAQPSLAALRGDQPPLNTRGIPVRHSKQSINDVLMSNM